MRASLFSPRTVATVTLLVVIGAGYTEAQSRVFTTCLALAGGLETSVSIESSEIVRDACESIFDDGSAEDTAVSGSSAGRVPFRVIGGDDSPVFTSTKTVDTRTSRTRPSGPWVTVVGVDVRQRASHVIEELKKDAGFFRIGLHGLGTSMVKESDGRVTVRLNNGDTVIFGEVEDNEDPQYTIYRIIRIPDTIFPGFDFQKSFIYVQVSSQGFFRMTTNIEVGWGPPPSFDVGGNLKDGTKVIESFLLQILSNFEGVFGRLCEFGINVRTVEGDCNNLKNVERGSAGTALKRFGGTDPAYPDGNVAIPSGPLHINVREISNALFAMSESQSSVTFGLRYTGIGPGSSILGEQAERLKTECYEEVKSDKTHYVVCPYREIRIGPRKGAKEIIPFDRVQFNDCEDLIFRFEAKKCTVDILLKCSGERRIELADDPCGAETNRLYDPVGCVIRSGEDNVMSNSDALNDLFFTFGQFVDHDFGLSPLSQISSEQPGFNAFSRSGIAGDFSIKVPENDFHMNREEMEFNRTRFSEEVPDSHINLHSSYLDASQIYGVDFKRSRLLRSFVRGRLELSEGELPPFNKIKGPGALGTVVENGPNTDGRFFVVGDARGNEQILLLAVHILFLREHNLVADEVAAAFPKFDDELIFQTARAIVTAEYQCIIYNEWLPLLLGKTSPSARSFKYDKNLDATVSAIFTTAAYRFGHSLVGTNLLSMGPGSRRKAEMELVPLRESFFKPEAMLESGIDPWIRGGTWHLCKELDNKIVDELRNFLVIDFHKNTSSSLPFDLVALNLQRGRDMGIPSFNDARELFGLERYTTFSDFIKDPNLADVAMKIYEDVDLVDLFFGGMVEEHVAQSQLGETFNAIIAEQFTRSRDGDRFFYTGLVFDGELMRMIPRVRDIMNHKIRFMDIILRNTNIKRGELGRRSSVFKI